MNNQESDDGDLTEDEQRLVDQLTPEEVAAIDDALLGEISERWRKVAMVVAMVMTSDEPGRRLGLPDLYYCFTRMFVIDFLGQV